VAAVEAARARPARPLRVLITSGGTSEPIDVKWGRPQEAINGPFGDLYERVFARLKQWQW